MHISRLLLSLFMLSSLVCSAYAMEEEKNPQKRDRKRDRISRAFKNLTIRPGRGESTPPEPTLHKSHSDEGPGAEESSGTVTIIIQPRAPKNSVDALPPHLLMRARSQAGIPQPPAPSMLVGQPDKQSLTGSPPKEEDALYATIELSETGQLTSTERSPQAPRHLSPEDANRPDEFGRTPLSHTIVHGDTATFVHLLESGADPHIRRNGNSMLHEAAMSRNPSAEIVRLLVELYGQDPNALSEGGLAPLHLAARSGTLDVFNVLVQLPNTLLDIRSQDIEKHALGKNLVRRTPLHILAAGRRRQAADMAQSLLKPGNEKSPADIYATDLYFKTPLEIATQTGSETMVRILLHHTLLGHKSVQLAYATCKSDTIKALFEERSDVQSSPRSQGVDTVNNPKGSFLSQALTAGARLTQEKDRNQLGKEHEHETAFRDDEEDIVYAHLSDF